MLAIPRLCIFILFSRILFSFCLCCSLYRCHYCVSCLRMLNQWWLYIDSSATNASVLNVVIHINHRRIRRFVFDPYSWYSGKNTIALFLYKYWRREISALKWIHCMMCNADCIYLYYKHTHIHMGTVTCSLNEHHVSTSKHTHFDRVSSYVPKYSYSYLLHCGYCTMIANWSDTKIH